VAILSIQSHVAFGHVGNAAATFPLQRLGCEVWPVHTVMFSNHTGYGSWRGPVLPAADIRAVVQGIAERGVLRDCEAVLSGYVGDPAVGEAILEAVGLVRAANPRALYCCDPVIGDRDRGVYVRPGVAEFLRERAVPAADLIVPNQFELELLTGLPAGSLAQVLAAADAALALGPRLVLVTSVERAEAPAGAVEMLLVSAAGAWLVATPRLVLAAKGTGDATAALFAWFWLRRQEPSAALEATAAAIHVIVAATAAAGARELALVAAQDAIVDPPHRFPAIRVR